MDAELASRAFGRILAIAVKTAHGGLMQELMSATAVVDGSLAEGASHRARRGVTFLSRPQWQAVTAELGVDLPWHSRRANVLLDAPALAPLLGRRIAFGGVVLQVHKETEPCRQMDRIHPGLMRSLLPDCRGGVYGQVIEGGVFCVGDEVRVV